MKANSSVVILCSLLSCVFAYTPCDLQDEFDTVMCKSVTCTNCDMEFCLNKCIAFQEKHNRCRCRDWPCSRKCYNPKACPDDVEAVPCVDPPKPTVPPKVVEKLEEIKEMVEEREEMVEENEELKKKIEKMEEKGAPPEKIKKMEEERKELKEEIKEMEEDIPMKKPPPGEEYEEVWEDPWAAMEGDELEGEMMDEEEWEDPWGDEGGDELEGEMMEEPEGGWGDEEDYYGDGDGGGLNLHAKRMSGKHVKGVKGERAKGKHLRKRHHKGIKHYKWHKRVPQGNLRAIRHLEQ